MLLGQGGAERSQVTRAAANTTVITHCKENVPHSLTPNPSWLEVVVMKLEHTQALGRACSGYRFQAEAVLYGGTAASRAVKHPSENTLVACPAPITTITLPFLVPSGPNQSCMNLCHSVLSLIAPEAQRAWLCLTSLIVLA